MYNYNLVNPVNITYRNPKQNPYTNKKEDEGTDSAAAFAQKPVTLDENKGQRHFPNGNKVQVDYTKSKINIAQVVEDFKSTIAAINAPEEVSSEVNLYLKLVENESKKENPSREIILSNLKNASKISDKFIEDSLKKPSSVVEDWVNALFLQHVELKSDPDFVNEAFRVQIPDSKKVQQTKAAELSNGVKEISANPSGVQNSLNEVSRADDFQTAPLNIYNIPQDKITINEIKPIGQVSGGQVYNIFSDAAIKNGSVIETEVQNAANEPFYNTEIETEPSYNTDLTYSTTASSGEKSPEAAVSFIENVDTDSVPAGVYRLNAVMNEPASIDNPAFEGSYEKTPETYSFISRLDENERAARNNFVRAKRLVKENGDPESAIKLYDEALKLVQDSNDDNLKAAIHFERGKVFDDYDYAEYALQDYNSATKCSDNNLKTHAHLKMGRIYDDYVMFDPAVEHYSIAVETSEEAQNPAGKTKALRYLAGLFADRYDKENTEIFNGLSVDSAYETGNFKIVAKTLMEAAENFEYIGEDIKALNTYKQAAKVLFDLQDYKTLSFNYEAASDIMSKLGNEAKAMSLLSKALLYRQKAELQTA